MNTICINEQPITIKEYNGQRVVTFREIDRVHGRPEGTASRTFRANRKRFVEGEDCFRRNPSEARNEFGVTAPNGLTLITESGYLMLVKSFNDELAWDVQRQLVNVYFKCRESVNGMVVKEPEPSNNLAQLLRENATCLIKLADMVDLFGNQEKYAYPLRNTAWILSAELTHSLDTTGPVMKYVGE